MRWKSGEKAGIYTSSMPLFFGFSFFFEKRTCIFFRKLNGSKTPKKQVSTLLHSHHPLALLFPLKKRTCASLRTPKRVEDPGKTVLSFGSSFFPEKKNTSTLSARSPQAKPVQVKGLKKKRKSGEKADNCALPPPLSFGSSLSPAINMCILGD